MTRLLSALTVLVSAAAAGAQPLSSAFTFQGWLTNANAPAAGSYDLRFHLYDALLGGTEVAPPLCADNVAVVDGYFTVQLDFGPSFRGDQSFIEVQVRADTGLGCSNNTGLITLGPRQAVTPAPNALFALSAATANDASTLGGQSASFYQSASSLNTGTVSDARLSTNVAKLNVAQTFTGALTLSNIANSYAGSGAGLLNLNASNLTTGLLSPSRGGTGADTSTATSGQVLKFNGTAWTPGADNDTQYTAGQGLVLNNTTFSIAQGGIDTIAIQDGGILNTDLSDLCVTAIKIANGAITGPKIAAGTILSSHIADGTIASNDIAAGGVSSLNIIDGTIAAADMSVGAVTTSAILDGTITAADFAVGAVGSAAIADNSVTSADIANGAIVSVDLAASAVNTAALAPDAVTSNKLASDFSSLERVSGGAAISNGSRVGIGIAPDLFATLLVNGSAVVNGEVNASFVTIQTTSRSYTVGPFDFAVRDADLGIAGSFSGEPELVNSSFSSATGAATIHLPQGAQVSRSRAFIIDTSSDDITVNLLRRSLDNSPGGTIATVASSGNATGFRTFTDSTISGGVIDNLNNMYYVTVTIPSHLSSLGCKGVTVEYTITRPLP